MTERKSPTPEERVIIGDGTTHDAFINQVHDLLARHGVSEEERQRILASAVCPCCGGSGASLVVKLNEDHQT